MLTAKFLEMAAIVLATVVPVLDAHAGTLTTLHSFSATGDGVNPTGLSYEKGSSPRDGDLFGTTLAGGASKFGTIYKLRPATGTETVLYSFKGGADGMVPTSGLIYQNGNFYGTTDEGGSFDYGTIFRFDPVAGTETVLYSFSGGSDGTYPYAGLTDYAGSLYGTTSEGGGTSCREGSGGCGTVFKVDEATGAETVLYRFQGGADGSAPLGGVIYRNGWLYGTTSAGNSISDSGIVFKVNVRTGAEMVLYSFTGGADGGLPWAGLTFHDGMLFGTTYIGGTTACQQGSGQCGTVFEVDPHSGAETVLYRFAGGSDGALPRAGVIFRNGILFGTTYEGGGSGCVGASGCGTVFELDPASGIETVLYGFASAPGAHPTAGLIHRGGTFYGTTNDGAPAGGSVFKIVP